MMEESLKQLMRDNFQVLLDRMQEGVLILENGRIVYANEPFARITGHSPEALLGQELVSIVHPDDVPLVRERHENRLVGVSEPEFSIIRTISAKGDVKSLSLHMAFLEGSHRLIVTAKDLSRNQEAEQEAESLKRELEHIIRKLPDIYYRTDMQGRLVRLSPSITGILGYEIHEVIGTPITDYYVNSKDREKIVKAVMDGRGEVIHVEAPLLHKNGDPVWFSTNAYLVMDPNGNPVGIEGLARDDSARKALENKLIEFSTIDPLTGLNNRRYLFERAEQEYKRSSRYGSPLSIMIMDLDHFKVINDTCGHHEGDRALQVFTSICKEMTRTTDLLGRIGGEEFMMILPETELDKAMQVAERIRLACENTVFSCDSGSLPIHVSIGIASRKNETLSLEEMRIQADRALYRAKEQGRNQVAVLESR